MSVHSLAVPSFIFYYDNISKQNKSGQYRAKYYLLVCVFCVEGMTPYALSPPAMLAALKHVQRICLSFMIVKCWLEMNVASALYGL